MASEKLQKVLAREGFGSRRQMERWIVASRVSVNDTVATLGMRVTLPCKVTIDKKTYHLKAQSIKTRILCYHKPLGEICSEHDRFGRALCGKNLPPCDTGRWIRVGRLDINTSGLLLYTNHGELAHLMMHPRQQLQREYIVRVFGKVDESMIKQLTAGVQLDDGPARFEDIVFKGGHGLNQWFHVVVVQGRNRMVRRLWASQGLEVSRLIRLRYGSIYLPDQLKQGSFYELPREQVMKIERKLLHQ